MLSIFCCGLKNKIDSEERFDLDRFALTLCSQFVRTYVKIYVSAWVACKLGVVLAVASYIVDLSFALRASR
jgi:hypothetical protein